MTKEFGTNQQGAKPVLPTYADRVAGENARLDAMRVKATPPVQMREAPVAPARGVMQLVPDYDIMPGGTRRVAGAHWVQPSRLDLTNARAVDAARAEDPDVSRAKAEVFSPAQVAMAARYRDLVEWIAGSGMKCSRLERGSGGNRATDSFHETYSDHSTELARLHAAIGDEVVLSPRRHMDRDNARKVLTVRVALDAMVLKGWTLTKVITKHGWAAKGSTRTQVRDAIRGALDRMQGYR
jgi:hypothetical protein